MKFFTIGYGGRNPQEFVDILKEYGITMLVDIVAVQQKSDREGLLVKT